MYSKKNEALACPCGGVSTRPFSLVNRPACPRRAPRSLFVLTAQREAGTTLTPNGKDAPSFRTTKNPQPQTWQTCSVTRPNQSSLRHPSRLLCSSVYYVYSTAQRAFDLIPKHRLRKLHQQASPCERSFAVNTAATER